MKLDQYSTQVLNRARETLANNRVHIRANDERVFDVRGNQDTYTVTLYVDPYNHEDVFPLCSCPNGGRRGGYVSCYHSAAVLLWFHGDPQGER